MSKQGENKIRKVLREFKRGKLKSSSGQAVTDKSQATAIALSEARQVDSARDNPTKLGKGHTKQARAKRAKMLGDAPF